MREILFVTGNKSKAKRFTKGLLEHDIKVLTLEDININVEVEENGSTAVENALIKARAYAKETSLPVFAMDDTLYIDNIPDDKQPGLFVRRVNGKTLNDEEMIEHYLNLVKEYGIDGKLNSKWIYGLAVIDENGEESTYTWYKDDFYMVDTKSSVINPGYPLNSISKYKGIDKYFTEVSEEEKEKIRYNEDNVVEFIAKHI